MARQKNMSWVYIIIGLVVVIGGIYWFRSKKSKGADLSATPPTPSETEPTETAEPTEREENVPSDDEEKIV